MALDDNPIKGPFPTGDSRNITLTKGSNADKAVNRTLGEITVHQLR